jgi:hypothetical protein
LRPIPIPAIIQASVSQVKISFVEGLQRRKGDAGALSGDAGRLFIGLALRRRGALFDHDHV